MRVACVAWAVLAVGCSGGPLSGGSSSSGDQPREYTAEELLREYFMKGCALGERCANTRGRDYTSRAECEATLNNLDALYLSLSGKGYFATGAENFRVGDQEKARTCLAKLDTVACTEQNPRDPDCEGVFTPINPRTAGQSCTGEDEICGTGLYCAVQASNPTCSLCTAYKANGASCDYNDECESGFCSLSGGTCAAPAFKQVGQACTDTEECFGSLVCAGAANQRTCQLRGGAGAACDGPNAMGASRPPCMTDLVCVTDAAGVTGSCTAMLADGQPCSRRGLSDAVTSSVCRNLCVFSSADATTGVCGSTAPVTAGSPCVGFQDTVTGICRLDDDSGIYADLAFNTDNNMFNITGCTCRTQVANGGACWFDSACSVGICDGTTFNPLMQGACGPKLANGQMCDGDDVCDSGFCNAQGTCAVKASCP